MRRLVHIVLLLLGLTTVGTVGIRILTGRAWLESAYLAVITLTTVGSEDVPRDDPESMLFIMGYLICGLGIVTYGAFSLGAMIIDAELRDLFTRRTMQRQISELEGHYVVCGMGRMGTAICEYLHARRQPFVVIDAAEERLQTTCREHGWMYIAGDATDDQVLLSAGIKRARGLATVLPTDADNVYVVLSARMLCSTVQIIARASDAAAMTKLQRAGATRVVSPFSTGAVKMARFMLNPSVEDFLEVTGRHGGELELADVQIAADSPYVGKALSETDLSERGVMVIGIRRASGEQLLPPSGSDRLQAGDSLFAFGSAAAVNRMMGD